MRKGLHNFFGIYGEEQPQERGERCKCACHFKKWKNDCFYFNKGVCVSCGEKSANQPPKSPENSCEERFDEKFVDRKIFWKNAQVEIKDIKAFIKEELAKERDMVKEVEIVNLEIVRKTRKNAIAECKEIVEGRKKLLEKRQSVGDYTRIAEDKEVLKKLNDL